MGMSQAFSLNDLQNLGLNETREMGHGCGPNIGGQQAGSGYDRLVQRGFGYPNNGEFAWGGLGSSCSQCSDPDNGYGCDNCSGSKAVSGRRGTVRRIAYLGDVNACCTTQPGLVNNQTCSPDYNASNYSNGKCNDPMSSMCAQGTNIVDNANCVTWRNAVGVNNGQAQALMKAYCSSGDNLTGSTCQQWLAANPTQLKGWYDTEAGKYCSSHPDNKTFCACYNLPTELTQNSKLSAIAVKPYCYYDKCSAGTGAYVSQDMMASTCPTIQVCNQTVNANLTDSEIKALNITCNQTSEATTTTNNNSASNTTTNNSSNSSNSSSSNNPLLNGSSFVNLTSSRNAQIAGGATLAILLIIGVSIYMLNRRENNTSGKIVN